MQLKPFLEQNLYSKDYGKMIRRRLGVITVAVLLTPVVVLLLVSNPDLTNEQDLIQKVADLRERLSHAEMTNRERRKDVLFLARKLKVLTNSTNSSLVWHLSPEAKILIENHTFSTDLHLPSVYSYMPHLLESSAATTPAFKMSAGRSEVSMVLGVPTVKRTVQSYLLTTLKNLVQSMTEEDKKKCLIVVLVSEFDIQYVHMVTSQIEKRFDEHLKSGLIEIIAPPSSFYPDMEKLRRTLGDSLERVRWRTKQNLDYAFLMMYCQQKGTFYVQLEDDIQTKKGYIQTMHNFALQKSTEKKDWIVLDFCQLGFIGKMFKCVDLHLLVQFFIMFYNDKPVDWLLEFMVQTKVCSLDKDIKTCKKAKDKVWIHYKPSLFQHIGTHSSLKGKVQKLKDKQYGKVMLHYPHSNPDARVISDIKPYKTFNLDRAYKGHTYFWGLLPQAGDKLTIIFKNPVLLSEYFFRSGNLEHPSDKLYNTTVEVLPYIIPTSTKLKKTNDDFFVLGEFDESGIAEREIDTELGKLIKLRLHVHVESQNWVIISEIHLKTLKS